MVRLAVPSYLVPGTWLENLETMEDMDWIEGVELLFFAYDEDARSIFGRERSAIAAKARRFPFSLHLPDPLESVHEELVAASRDFVGLYVLHPPKDRIDAWARLVDAWRARYGGDFLLEYTGRGPFEDAEAALPGLPLCADTGCLLLDGESPAAWIGERSGRTREIHLHGASGIAAGGRDHLPFSAEEPWLADLHPLLSSFSGRIVLEIFSLHGVETARRALESLGGKP